MSEPSPNLKTDFAQAVEHHQAGRFAEAELHYRRIIAQHSDHADAIQLLGVLCNQTERPAEALSLLDRAIQLNPARADYHNNLGLVLAGQRRWDAAIDAFRKALSLRSDFAQAHNNLGNVLAELGRFDEAMRSLREAISLQPGYAEAHNNLGNVHQNLRDAGRAIASYRRALELRPGEPEVRVALASTFLLSGDFAQGFPLYEARWETPAGRAMARTFAQPLWDGSPLAGRRILLHAEQGLGDTIQFIRYVPLVKEMGGVVSVLCPPELRRLLTGQLGIEQIVTDLNALPAFDVHCPILSLPRVLRTTLHSIPARVPYLTVDPTMSRAWQQRLDAAPKGLKVGLVWAGSPKHRKDHQRSIPPEELAPLAAVGGVRFISLQKGDASSTRIGLNLVDWTAELTDLADTAALIANLDLVICVDTAVAHLAGALARPVWLLLPFAPDWRWMWDRADSPWYPTMRLFRQSSPGNWAGVIAGVVDALLRLSRLRVSP
ncbi:MAG TPA: tetratricopeptide repeat-containing glycosyltransferase family protein [Tepidisphaeraceae bacterium]|jgi:Flp pilus assembly protein TadD|nr:tetratricopeptide repeat-containing glycosyltransferase family protein [Tepidisphaeraceae bacterium]